MDRKKQNNMKAVGAAAVAGAAVLTGAAASLVMGDDDTVEVTLDDDDTSDVNASASQSGVAHASSHAAHVADSDDGNGFSLFGIEIGGDDLQVDVDEPTASGPGYHLSDFDGNTGAHTHPGEDSATPEVSGVLIYGGQVSYEAAGDGDSSTDFGAFSGNGHDYDSAGDSPSDAFNDMAGSDPSMDDFMP